MRVGTVQSENHDLCKLNMSVTPTWHGLAHGLQVTTSLDSLLTRTRLYNPFSNATARFQLFEFSLRAEYATWRLGSCYFRIVSTSQYDYPTLC